MQYITIEEVKQHLRIDSDYTFDDNYIDSLISVAQTVISNDIQRDLSTYDEIPTPLKHAMLLLIGDYYNNREDSNDLKMNTIPNGIKRLIAPYINYL